MNTQNGTNPLIQPPADLLIQVTNPTTNQPGYAFPLQTNTWLKMQDVVTKALKFPLSSADFQDLYGTFSDEGSVETAVNILGQINTTAAKYGDPQTLISSLSAFQQADTPPSSIYGHAVWLAAQTLTTAQQIGALLQDGLTDIGQETDPAQRLQDLTALLTGQGGINSYATTLQDYIGRKDPGTGKYTGFIAAVTDFYDELNPELTGPTNSLQWYLNQSDNVYKDAQNAVSSRPAADRAAQRPDQEAERRVHRFHRRGQCLAAVRVLSLLRHIDRHRRRNYVRSPRYPGEEPAGQPDQLAELGHSRRAEEVSAGHAARRLQQDGRRCRDRRAGLSHRDRRN